MQDGQRQPVLGQEHVGAHHGEVGLVALERLGAVAHVVVEGELETDVLVAPDQGLRIGLEQRRLRAVAGADRHREGGGPRQVDQHPRHQGEAEPQEDEEPLASHEESRHDWPEPLSRVITILGCLLPKHVRIVKNR